MPKFTQDMVAGHYLYFTSLDKGEAFHAHASSRRLVEAGSAKFWVFDNGDTEVADKGTLAPHEITKIRKYIKLNHKQMEAAWLDHFGSISHKRQ